MRESIPFVATTPVSGILPPPLHCPRYCAIHKFPPDPPLLALHRTLFVTAISCERQPSPPVFSLCGAGAPRVHPNCTTTARLLRNIRRPPPPWPLPDICLVIGFCTRVNIIIRKHPLCLGTPLTPFIAHTIAQYSVFPRPSCIAMHAIQYW